VRRPAPVGLLPSRSTSVRPDRDVARDVVVVADGPGVAAGTRRDGEQDVAPLPTFGVGTTVQDLPSQCSISVCRLKSAN
jgi:hypothetical protein